MERHHQEIQAELEELIRDEGVCTTLALLSNACLEVSEDDKHRQIALALSKLADKHV